MEKESNKESKYLFIPENWHQKTMNSNINERLNIRSSTKIYNKNKQGQHKAWHIPSPKN
jgi:hypothetical protein